MRLKSAKVKRNCVLRVKWLKLTGACTRCSKLKGAAASSAPATRGPCLGKRGEENQNPRIAHNFGKERLKD